MKAPIPEKYALCTALLGGVLAAQEPADPILARLSAETTNVVVVRDPVALIAPLLASPEAVAVLTATADAQRLWFGRAFDTVALQRQLDLMAPMIPVEIVVAAPTRTMDRLSHAAPLFACCTALQMLARGKGTDDAVLARIRAAAQQNLAQLDGMPLQAWVRARDERTAEGWFDTLAKHAQARGKELGLTVELRDARMTLRGEPFAAGASARRALDAAGIDASTAPAWVVDATIEQRGAVIELTVGKLAPPPCAAARLHPWPRDGATLLFARSEVGEGVAYLTGAYDAVTAVAGADLARGDTALMGQLLDFLGRVDAVTTNQSVALQVAQGVVWTHEKRHESPPGDSDTDVPLALARLLRPDDGPFAVTCDRLDVVLTMLIDTLLPVHLDDEDYSMSTLMRTQWRGVIEFLDGEDSAVFMPGTLLVTRENTLPAAGERPARPFAGVALVARTQSNTAGAGFMASLATHIGAAADLQVPLWRETELGLGVPAYAFNVAGVAPQLQPFVDAGGFVPHWFAEAGMLVLSTDPGLSKELIARARGEARPLPQARLLRWAQLRGDHLEAAVAAVEQWPELSGDAMARTRSLLEALRAVVAHIELVETVSFVGSSAVREQTTLRLRQPVAPK
ncbi:MAG TPA: hypothetical protein VFD82_06495 [Planctomycetota bacterium]|nr:hypothetical protein [Planctomycetota bacterium]